MNDDIIRYVHKEIVHNFRAANESVPFIIDLLQPESVVDVGCGTGTWLKVFEDNGVKDILGIDGDYVDKKLLNIDSNKYQEYDLETVFKSQRKFDLAISLEVAEHLSFESADIFVETLSGLSETIIFSAAIINQGGQNHINEQEPKYWIEKFEKQGFQLFDVLRPIFWENEKIDWWYRQNMFLFTKDIDLKINLSSLGSFSGKFVVHPDLYKDQFSKLIYCKNQFERINDGTKSLKFYCDLLLKVLKTRIKKIIRQN